MSSRKRRYSEIDESFQWRGSEETRRRSEGNRPARDQADQGLRDWRARGDREAGIQSSGDQRTFARDRRPRDHRTQDRVARYAGDVSPKRRRVADERERTREEVTPLRYMALMEICESKSPEDGILDLQNKEERLKALLQSPTEIDLGRMHLLIHALHLCCLTKSVTHHADHLLRLVTETNFLGLHLSRFLSRMLLFSISNKDFQPSDLILRLSDLFLEMLKRFGREIVHSIPSAQLGETFDRLKNRNFLHNTDVLQEKIRQVKALKEEVINKEHKSVLLQEDQTDIEPPDNFRDICVIPQAADLSIAYKPFLRVNVINRRYRDLEHYLDVQFRLLREDCVLPLREGVKQLRKDYGNLATSSSSGDKTAKDVYVYRDVAVLYPACSRKGMVYRIRFDSFHYSLRHINWEKSKRLKFGTLLCLSADDFYTLLFATVENRDPSELQQGELEVRFENVELKKLNRFIETKKKFDMVESPAFFEAYRHVLEALQEIKSPDGLPFQEHIVLCSKNVKPPQLEQITGGDYDMTGIVQGEVYDCGEQASVPLGFTREGGNSATEDADTEMISSESSGISDHRDIVNVHDLQHYRYSLEFNDSQLRAFQMALTKRFAVIQGPPGTGKTYVGLKIAQVLLQTSLLWENEEERTPMLMVSYTNHALDQFLEGLLPMPGIVRVGSRSKSSKLESCLLKFLREQARESKETPGRISRARTKAKKKMRKISESGNLELSTAVLKFSRRGVLSFHVLKQFMSEPHAECFERDEGRSAVDVFCDWLGVERSVLRKDVADRDDSGFDNEDFQRQFSLRAFANEDDVEEDDWNSINPSEVVICDAEETSKPAEIRRNLQDESVLSEDEEKQAFFLQRLTKQRRWELYRLWLARAEKHYLQQLQDHQPDYEKALARLNELVEEENFHVLQKARVIGMTTTCAARNRRILQRICPQIVLVEEAAEVLEAHIITSLTKECRHLILIGDHQQLRPTPAVYELAKKYKLDVSLFERMVNVGIPCERLSVQHRMRPEIAALLRHIYRDLENHESVEQYEHMKGLKKNLFFINHCHLEKSSSESHSHTNEHEASFLVALCRYLLQQGYKTEQLTILTTYMGQMFSIRDCLRDENDQAIRNVRVTTVDNFQGEENDVILLSLVRSNKEEKVGFIKIVNRACVALSRAKMGFYCIGNFDLLSRHSVIWSKIVSDLKASSCIGSALPLECQIHHTEVFVKTARDFRSKVPHGGCQCPCKVRLKCGHACRKLCHPDDIDHEGYRCGEPCHRTVKGCTHLCPKLCCEECEKYCTVLVDKTLPLCGHVEKVCCGKDPDRVTCTTQCEKTLPCGHRCQEKCGKPCTKKCRELVKKCDWPCGHDVTVACSAEPTDCPFPCRATLECSHQCSGACGECRMGRVHKRCGLRCGRVLVCSHVCREACVLPCPPCPRSCENRCVHSECKPKKCGEPCVPCLEKCPWQCRHYKCSKLCGDFCDRPRCNEPCRRTLSCGSRRRRHFCRGLCGEPCICEICDSNDLSPINEPATLFVQLPDCKHIFAFAELDRYMDPSDESLTDSHVIKLKPCPRCNTPIRTSLRYGNVIKQRLQDIEEVKLASHGHPSEMTETKERLLRRLNQLKTISIGKDTERDLQRLERSVNRIAKGTMAVVTENQVTLMERFYMLNQRLAEGPQAPHFSRAASCMSTLALLEGIDMKKELEWLRKRFMSTGVTERELRDINVELTRQKLQLELLLLQCDVRGFGINLKITYTDAMEAARKELSSGRLISERRLGEMLEQLGAIRQNYRYLSPLTEEEKKEILSAMNLSQGHWYKCPQGHVYSIGGCGQAMQRTTCPECRRVIGGRHHQLFEGNTRAPEMEGTSRPRLSVTLAKSLMKESRR